LSAKAGFSESGASSSPPALLDDDDEELEEDEAASSGDGNFGFVAAGASGGSPGNGKSCEVGGI
jgi:hypothetical protein